MWLVFLGPPGAGKGTQSERLIKHLSARHVSTGDILREAVRAETEEGKQVEQYLTAGQLVPDECIIQIFERHIATLGDQDNILFDGFPRTLAQAASLEALLVRRGTPLDGAFYLQVANDELLKRLAGRGRKDDQLDVIRQRLEVFSNQTQPLIEYYEQRGLLHVIDGVGTEDEVFDRIQDELDDIRQRKNNDEASGGGSEEF